MTIVIATRSSRFAKVPPSKWVPLFSSVDRLESGPRAGTQLPYLPALPIPWVLLVDTPASEGDSSSQPSWKNGALGRSMRRNDGYFIPASGNTGR